MRFGGSTHALLRCSIPSYVILDWEVFEIRATGLRDITGFKRHFCGVYRNAMFTIVHPVTSKYHYDTQSFLNHPIIFHNHPRSSNSCDFLRQLGYYAWGKHQARRTMSPLASTASLGSSSLARKTRHDWWFFGTPYDWDVACRSYGNWKCNFMGWIIVL